MCSDDKTEFLQELGRLRIDQNDKINLYIRKVDQKAHISRKNLYETNSKLFRRFCGEKDTAPLNSDEKLLEEGHPSDVVKRLWNDSEDPRRNLIHLTVKSDGTLKPMINLMARWRTILLGEQIKDYEALLDKSKETAPILYKAQWLKSTQTNDSEFSEYLQTLDLDVAALNQTRQKLLEFLRQQAENGVEMEEDSDLFETFSRDFQEHYAKAYPEDKSVNLGRNREPWKEGAIKNHLEKINDDKEAFELVKIKPKGKNAVYKLQMKDKSNVGE